MDNDLLGLINQIKPGLQNVMTDLVKMNYGNAIERLQSIYFMLEAISVELEPIPEGEKIIIDATDGILDEEGSHGSQDSNQDNS